MLTYGHVTISFPGIVLLLAVIMFAVLMMGGIIPMEPLTVGGLIVGAALLRVI